MSIKEKVMSLPNEPGIYIFKDSNGNVIYIGKAKSLKSRVSSYFQSGILPGTKTYALISKITDLDFIQVETELEALILESDLIKKHRPHYNIIQKDDKSYLYIVIRPVYIDIKEKKGRIYNVFTARETDLKKTDIVYGPYPNGTVAKEILKKLRIVFKFKDCSDTKFSRFKKIAKPCLYGHLNLCSAPCVNNLQNDIKQYQHNIIGLKKVLSGKSTSLIKELRNNMRIASNKQKYEEAAYYRDIAEKYNYISHTFRSADKYLQNPYLIDDLASKSLSDLVKMIPILINAPVRIECYDISNISGKNAVGSMVVALDGKIAKGEFRRFKIKSKDSPDDFGMLREVLMRRLSHSIGTPDKKPWPKPDLLLIDGGKGQVGAVINITKELNLDIVVVGIAKKFESLVYKNLDNYIVANYPKDSEGMKLITRLRDEAHRFAQSYHHLLRSKKLKD